MIRKGLTLKNESQEQVFADIDIYSRDFVNVGALYGNGFVAGDINGNFEAKRSITYDEVSVILDRILNKYGIRAEAAECQTLVGRSAGYAHSAVKRLADTGIITDIESYNGMKVATRADIADMIYKTLVMLKRI